MASAPAASAHDELVSSNPRTNERFSSAPSSVALRFSAPLLKIGNEIRVVDAASTNWVRGEAVLARETLTQPLSPDLPPGEYQVRWRVVSSDGHAINGSYSFLVGAGSRSGSIPAPGPATKATSGPADAVQPGADVPAQASALPGWAVAAVIGAIGGVAPYLLWGFVGRVRKSTRSGD
ncbi:copper resistance CopC family protein [Paenarthrobacter nitroguajacolicus]|uniref:copper resistance CopC family protein n=1 Tax=Paenarthrobacter nitroguajacolicus TaxID=211146 RepID=UPI003426193D